jgi:N-sulfoglucosamine sulfohydrolase
LTGVAIESTEGGRIMTTLKLTMLGLALMSAQAVGADSRPNVVLIIADDLGGDDAGAFGNAKIRTPNIDALARGGMAFDRAFVTASSCSPSRSSLITGRYPHATGAEELHWPLPVEQVTFVEKLKAAGYYTAAAGKWHLGNPAKVKFNLVREGNPAAFQLAANSKSKMNAEGTSAAQAGCDQWVPVLRDRPKDRPFFLWLASFDPHRDYQEGTIAQPHRPEDVVVPPYLPDVPEVRKDLALYDDEAARLDHYVGEVLAELARQGVADDTLVIFLGDNGRPFPRCKTTLYDSGIKTPLIARWPGHIPAGTRSSSLVSTVDLAPTILKLAGLAPMATVQGKDLSPIFKDPSAKVREAIFAERNWHDFASRGRAARSERFKYIKNDDFATALTPPSDAVRSPTFLAMRRLRDEGKLTPAQSACFVAPRPAEELYDLANDPDELTNLAADPNHAETLDAMRRTLADWTRETKDVRPETLSPDEFDRETGDPLPNRQRPRLPRRLSRSER